MKKFAKGFSKNSYMSHYINNNKWKINIKDTNELYIKIRLSR